MEYLELIMELVPYVLSIIATVAAFKKGKKTLTVEEIEAKAEEKKQIYKIKLERKNHIPSKVEEMGTYENTNQNLSDVKENY